MNKQEIIENIRWRIEDCEDQYEFAIANAKQSEEELGNLRDSFELLRERMRTNPTEDVTKQFETIGNRLFGRKGFKKPDEEIDQYYATAYKYLIMEDTLNRLLGSIMEDEDE